MFEKLKNDKRLKDLLIRTVMIFIIIGIALLTVDVITTSRDGRTQIIDENGSKSNGAETTLRGILSDIKGVGAVNVMVTYDSDSNVQGVIVTAEGGGSSVIKSNITSAVANLYGIPLRNVSVFEKESEVD